MLTTTMSTKGQLIIPNSIRQAHDWVSGTRFLVIDAGSELLLKPVNSSPSLNASDVAGCIKYKGPKISIKEMAEAPYQLARKAKK